MSDRVITDEELSKLEAQYKRIQYVRAHGHEFVFKGPDRAQCRSHQLAIKSGRCTDVEADTELLQFLIVRFDGKSGQAAVEAWNAFIDARPMASASGAINLALLRLTGIVEEEAGKGWTPPSTPSAAIPSS